MILSLITSLISLATWNPLLGLLQPLYSPPFSQHRRHAFNVGFLHWLFPLARIHCPHTANALTFSKSSQISVTSQWSLTWSVHWKLQFIPYHNPQLLLVILYLALYLFFFHQLSADGIYLLAYYVQCLFLASPNYNLYNKLHMCQIFVFFVLVLPKSWQCYLEL